MFREALEEACGHLDELLGCGLASVMFAADEPGGEPVGQSLLHQTMFTQAGLFAFEVALFRLLGSWGVRPDYVMGHSIGELAAAHVAGVFSLQDACRLVAARGRLMGALPEGGAMVSVQASEAEALDALVGLEERVALAAVNGPSSVVLSGDQEEVLRLAHEWRQRGRKTKRLQVSHAFHSPRMDGMLEQFAEVASGLSFSQPEIPVVSNVTGRLWSERAVLGRVLGGARAPHGALRRGRPLAGRPGRSQLPRAGPGRRAQRDGCGVLVEVVGGEGGGAAAPATVLKAEHPEAHSLIAALAEMWTRGVSVDWAAMLRRVGRSRSSFRRTPFSASATGWRVATVRTAPPPQPRGSPIGPAGCRGASFWDAVEREDLEELLGVLRLEGEDRRSSLGELLPSLSVWHRRSRERATLSGWRYRVEWKPIASASTPALSGAWLAIVPAVDEDRWIDPLAAALEQRGAQVVRVRVEAVGATRGSWPGLCARPSAGCPTRRR